MQYSKFFLECPRPKSQIGSAIISPFLNLMPKKLKENKSWAIIPVNRPLLGSRIQPRAATQQLPASSPRPKRGGQRRWRTAATQRARGPPPPPRRGSGARRPSRRPRRLRDPGNAQAGRGGALQMSQASRSDHGPRLHTRAARGSMQMHAGARGRRSTSSSGSRERKSRHAQQRWHRACEYRA
jgi:hypothetical protein